MLAAHERSDQNQAKRAVLDAMNRVALITGASRGIGRGIALELARIGFDLVINYATNAKAAKETAEDCAALAATWGHTIRAELCQADISSRDGRQKLLAFAKGHFFGQQLYRLGEPRRLLHFQSRALNADAAVRRASGQVGNQRV